MVLPLCIVVVVTVSHEPTILAVLYNVEHMDCVRFGDLREDRLSSGRGQGAGRRLWNAQVDIPRWWRYRRLYGQECGRNLASQINDTSHFIVPVVHLVTVFIYHADRRGYMEL